MPNEMSAETWNAVISVNLLAPLQFTLELLPSLAAQGGGHILNVCSLLGLVPGRKLTSYQTSKFGLVGFSLGLRTACFVQSIGVTALCPGLVDTPMLSKWGRAGSKNRSASVRFRLSCPPSSFPGTQSRRSATTAELLLFRSAESCYG